tara:strand:+ start:256 stop:555 length:300 start_codon:yes stop_codon:yes gene_type:complete
MDFKELEEKYNLDFNKLAQLLKKQHIILKLEHLNDIPVEWIPIIETSLGMVKPSKTVNKVKDNELIRLRKQRQIEIDKKQNEVVENEEDIIPIEPIKTK